MSTPTDSGIGHNHGNDRLAEVLRDIRNSLDEAKRRDIPDSAAVSLATAGSDGRPSVRTIYLSQVSDEGLVFFINMDSGKGRQIAANPQAGMCMYWPELQEQITLEGTVEVMPDAVSDELWRHRSRDSQLASWVSDQGPASEDRSALTDKRDQIKTDFDFASVPRPPQWKALMLRPARIEFWKTGWHHMRQRRLYIKDAHGDWHVETENP